MTRAIEVPSRVSGSQLAVVHFDGSASEWDQFMAGQEGSTFCHLSGWRQVMAEILGHECIYMCAVDRDGRWHGAMPLVRVRSRVFGHFLVSMPFVSYGGPLGSAEAQARLVDGAVEQARQSGADLLELRARHRLPGDLRVCERKVTVLLQLPASAETLWQEGFPAKLRSQIRRPQKEGMEVRYGVEQALPFYEVYARNMRDLGTPVLPRAFFERIAHVFAETAVIGVVYWRDRPVAAGWGFVWGGEFEISWASSLREYNRYAPNMLLYWSLMEEMIARRVSVFNFGRCTPRGGTHRFKLQWGGRDVPLPWAQWSRAGVRATPSPDGPLYRLATTVWQRIPLAITNRLGPVLARCLP